MESLEITCALGDSDAGDAPARQAHFVEKNRRCRSNIHEANRAMLLADHSSDTIELQRMG